MTLQPGAVLRHYEIRGLLGKGGMGEVWRAYDTRLKREIAIKVLPAAMSSSAERLNRFQREAESVARLSHPNIVTIYSVEEEQGVHFLTMELVNGRSLDTLVTGDGLPVDEVLRIGIAVASALTAAHDKQVIHRDLKPANILIGDDNVVKVLDFGLAKLTDREPLEESAATAVKSPVTVEGTVMGTVAYMSPEQARGRSVDQRTDLFSFGIVLFELMTGRRPFRGETSADVSSAILRETPPLVSDVKSGVPRDLARVIARCLEKDPDRRASSARDVRNELQSIGTEQPRMASRHLAWIGLAAVVAIAAAVMILRPNEKVVSRPVAAAQITGAAPSSDAFDPSSIAVLPFADLSPAKDQQYFSDGIAEEVLNLLVRIPELRVTSRSSAFALKAKGAEVHEIARTLRVAHILDGSVRTAGNRMRITARLIDTSSDSEVWSQTWDRELSDVFAIQDEIASDVASQLKVSLLGAAPRARKTSAEAYAAYLQGLQRQQTRTADDLSASQKLLRRAVEIDPRYAPAWAALSNTYLDQANLGAITPDEGRRLARDAALRALDADPLYGEAHARLAMILMHDDLAAAARQIERGFAVEPANPALRTAAIGLLRNLGRLDEAIRLSEESIREDPLNQAKITAYALTLRDAGRLDEARALLDGVLERNPRRGVTRGALAKVLLLKGDSRGALAVVEQEPTETFRLIGLAMAQYALGQKDESNRSLATLTTKYADGAAFNIAEIHAFQGNRDQAFAWLDKAVETHDTGLQAIATNPFLKPLHSDPRWQSLLKRIGRDPQTLAKIAFSVPAVARRGSR